MTGAPLEPTNLAADDPTLSSLNDLPPPSYEAARAAGAVPPPRPGQLPAPTATPPTTTIENTQPESSTYQPSSSIGNVQSYSPPPRTAVGDGAPTAWGMNGGNAIALQPIPHSPMSAQSQAQAQAAPNTNTNSNNRNIKVVPLHLMDEKPEWVECQFCKKKVQTRVVKKGKVFQCLTGTVFCVLCVCLTPLPCCLHWFEQAQWFCTSCDKQIAVRVRDAEIKVFPATEAAPENPARHDAVLADGHQQAGPHPSTVTPSTQQPRLPPTTVLLSQPSPLATASPQAHSFATSLPAAQEQHSLAAQVQNEDRQLAQESRAQVSASTQEGYVSQAPEDQGEPAHTTAGQETRQLHPVQQPTVATSEGGPSPRALPLKF